MLSVTNNNIHPRKAFKLLIYMYGIKNKGTCTVRHKLSNSTITQSYTCSFDYNKQYNGYVIHAIKHNYFVTYMCIDLLCKLKQYAGSNIKIKQ